MARTVVQRLLHAPTTRLRRAAQEDDDETALGAARALFGLGEDGVVDAPPASAAL